MQTKFVSRKYRFCILLVLLLASSPQITFGQQRDHSQLIKIGLFFYPFEYRYNGFSIHLEMENSFSKKKSFSTGPRADFVSIKNGDPVLLLGYNFKFYPFFNRNKMQNKGFFIAIAPVMKPKIFNVSNERYGPGVSGLLGYQFFSKDDMSFSVEGSWIYLRDISKYSSQFNPDRTYVYVYANLKVGIRLSRWVGSKE